MVDRPEEVMSGVLKITLSRCLVITDFIEVGGLGGALFNAALTGLVSLLALRRQKFSGEELAALWLSFGFGFFGKNLFNMIPIVLGVRLYSVYHKLPYEKLEVVSLLSCTLAPMVSEVAFAEYVLFEGTSLEVISPFVKPALAVLVGALLGFLMPVVVRLTRPLHGGMVLYNAGLAGGMVALVAVSLMKIAGQSPQTSLVISSGNNLAVVVLIGIVALLHLVMGVYDRRVGAGDIRVNMGLLGVTGLVLALLLGAELGGFAIAGVLTMLGFGAFGKRLVDCLPVLVGAVLASFIDPAPPSDPGNIGAVLFSTGLAPVCARYGRWWGMAAGFLHVSLNLYMGGVTGGFNLYNNGFTAAFAAFGVAVLANALDRNYKH